MTTIEHREIRGITLKNLVVTIISTLSIVIAVIGTYFELRNIINDISIKQEAQNRINEIRLKVLEDNVFSLQKEMYQLKSKKDNT